MSAGNVLYLWVHPGVGTTTCLVQGGLEVPSATTEHPSVNLSQEAVAALARHSSHARLAVSTTYTIVGGA